MFGGEIEPVWARENRAVKRTSDGAVVYTHPRVTSTFHVQNSIKFTLYSQRMLQNIIPPQKMLQNTLTNHSITSPRRVTAPLEVMRHLNSVQVPNAHACAVQTANSFTSQPHDGVRTLRINSWQECTQSRWILKTIQFGYRLQFAASPPAFQRDNSFSGAGEIKACSSGRNLLSVEKKGDKSGPTRAEPQRVLLEVFPRPKERDSSSPSHIRSACAEQVLKEVQVQDAHSFYTSKISAPWRLVYVNRPEGRILSHKDISTPQEIPAVCFPWSGIRISGSTIRLVSQPPSVCKMYRSGTDSAQGKGHSSRYLHRRLAGDSSVRARSERTHSYASGTHTETGVRIKHRKECFNSHTVYNISGTVTELGDVQSETVRRQSEKIHSLHDRFSEGKQCFLSHMPQTIRTNGLSPNSCSLGQIVHERVSTLGSVSGTGPTTSLPAESESDVRGSLGTAPVETPDLFGSRGTHGRGSSQTSSNNGRVVVRLGGHSRGQDSEWKMGSTSDQSSHKLFGNASRLSDGEAFPSLSQRASCSRENGQHYSCGLHKPTGRSQITSFAHVSTQTNFMEQCQSFVPVSDARTGCYEQGCGSAVQGQSPLRGVEIEQGSGRTDLGHIRQSDRGSVRVPRQCSVSSVFLPERSERASGDRCVGARMASHSPLRVPTDSVDIPNTLQSEGGGTTIDTNSSEVAREVLASGDHTYAVQRPVVSPAAQRSFITSRGGHFSSSPRTPGTMGLACEWFNLNTTGLSDSVIRTIQNARASSTRSLYECKWGVFERWCATKHEIPFQCSVAVVLSFLQDLIDQGKAFSTVKVYLAAISACHIGFDNKTVGQNPLICRFMKGARRALPVSKPLSPSWDLGLVLDALSMSPFEPLDKVDVKILSFKTALLLALASAKRVSEIHALSVHSACLQFMSGDSGVCLKPNPAFMPKILKAIIPLELRAFYPPPFASSEQQKLNALCPVRALRIYTERTREFRESDQLFVSWMKPRTGKPITKQRLSHWIVEAISLAYSSKGLVSPPGLRAHSTRGMSTSWALFKGVTLQDICKAASWTSPHTFARFYKLDVTAQTLAHAVLSVGMWVTSHDSFSPGCSDCGWQETSRQAIWQYGS